MALQWAGSNAPAFSPTRPVRVGATRQRDNFTLARMDFTVQLAFDPDTPPAPAETADNTNSRCHTTAADPSLASRATWAISISIGMATECRKRRQPTPRSGPRALHPHREQGLVGPIHVGDAHRLSWLVGERRLAGRVVRAIVVVLHV